jgi:hypothetical protein
MSSDIRGNCLGSSRDRVDVQYCRRWRTGVKGLLSVDMNKIGYPCIFSRTTDEAVENLLRLIVGRQCGFDEGARAWCDELKIWLEDGKDLTPLNASGANYDGAQWRDILERVVRGLDAIATSSP